MTYPESNRDHWNINDIAFADISIDHVRSDENLFYLLTCASFVESASDLYTDNLTSFYHDDQEVSAWLEDHWQVEELQHGQALRAYVHYVWPEFDWEGAYQSFLAEYAQSCKTELLEPTKALEMVARCVVESGTATYYRALARSTDEPVLQQLTNNIATDEINHYKHFYHHFRRYRELEGTSRRQILSTLYRRLMAIRHEDADCAIRHAIQIRVPQHTTSSEMVKQLTSQMNAVIRTNIMPNMAIKMIARPLNLPAPLLTAIAYPARHLMERAFLR